MKDWQTLIGVVVGAVLAWIAGQLAQWMASRRDEKKAIARALSDLLEIRVRLLAVPRTAEIVSKLFPVPPEAQAAIKMVFSRIFPPDVDIGKRYGEAVTLVAGSNPVLAFRMRSQDIVSPYLDNLRQLAMANGPTTAVAFAHLEGELMGHLKPHLDELIKELAWLHGWSTWWKVCRRLNRPMDLPEGLMESIQTTLAGSGQGHSPATVPSQSSDGKDLLMPPGFSNDVFAAVLKRISETMKNPSDELNLLGGASNGIKFRLRACADYGAGFTQSIQQSGDAPPIEERYRQETFLFSFFVSGAAVLDSLAMFLYVMTAQIRPSEFPIEKDSQLRGINCKAVAERLERAFPGEALTATMLSLVDEPQFHEFYRYRNILAHRAAPGRVHYLSAGTSTPDPAADWRITPDATIKIDTNLTPPRLDWLLKTVDSLMRAADEFSQKHS